MTALWILGILAGMTTGSSSAPAWPGLREPIEAVWSRTLGPSPSARSPQPVARRYRPPGPTDLPSTATGPVPYVIVTSEALREPFDSLAAWHTRYGLPTAVRVTSWIYDHYPGSDPQEKIRNFLRDAYREWGTRYVLLGGGANDVPPRYVYVRFSSDSIENWVPSDLYYACLDGSWNADGDAVFGEPEDSLDLVPELLVGRVPARFPEDAWNYLDKVRVYREMPGGDSTGTSVDDPERILLLGTLIGLNHGPLYCEYFAQHLPSDRMFLKLYESDTHDNTLDDFLDALAQGVGFFYYNGHGNYNSLYVNYNPGVPLGADLILTRLPNKHHLPLMKAVVCDAGAWDRLGVLSYLLMVPQAGAIGIIGTARFDIPASQLVFDTLLAKVLYEVPNLTFGAAALSQVGALPLVAQDSVIRYLYLGKTLLGDPALLFWQRPPRRLEVRWTPQNLTPGLHTLTVEVRDAATGEPVPGVTVVAYKATETYAVGLTDVSGTLRMEVHPRSPGTLWIALRHGDYLPQRHALPVLAGAQDVRPVALILREIQGDGDQDPDAGETFRLSARLQNFGRDTAYRISASWESADPWVGLLHATTTVEALPPGKELELEPPALLWVGQDLPRRTARVVLRLRWHASLHAPPPELHETVDTFRLSLHRYRVAFSHFRWQSTGAEGTLYAALVNTGDDDAESLRVRLESADGAGTVDPPDEVLLPVLPADAQPREVAFGVAFLANPDHPPQFHLSVFQGARLLLEKTWIPGVPSPPSSLDVLRELQTLTLTWSTVPGSRYRVFRRAPGDTAFRLLTPVPLTGGHYTDAPIDLAGAYAYFVETVDSAGNLSLPSETLGVALPLLHPGFPAPSGIGQESNHPVVADLDPEYPGLEIVFGDVLGRVYAYHADGTPVAGWPVETEPEIWNAPAVGDLDGDQVPEVVVAPRMFDNRVYVFHADGTPMEGWPQPYPGGGTDGTAGAYASPVIADLDGDGFGEIILHTLLGRVYVWRHDGTPYLGTSPEVLATGATSWDTGTPAVADLTGDGLPEILVPAASPASLYAIQPSGDPVPGFPLNLGAPVRSPVVVGEINGAPTLAFVSAGGLYLGRIQWLRADGTPFPGFPKEAFLYYGGLYAQPSLIDFNGDGTLDLALNRGDSVVVYDTLGHTLFSAAVTRGQNFGGVVGGPQLLFFNDPEGYLRGWNLQGPLPEFPLAVYDHLATTPVATDLDTDGLLEYVVLTAGRLLVFDLPYGVEASAWPMFQHDPRHTGYAPAPARHGSQGNTVDMPQLLVLSVAPQPFQGVLGVTLQVPAPRWVTLALYDGTGRRRATRRWYLASGGRHLLRWSPGPLPSGVYFLRIQTPQSTLTRKVLHLR